MAKKVESTLVTVDEFVMSIDEFIAEMPLASSAAAAAFKHAARKITGHKYRNEWQALMAKFMSLPTGIALTE